MSRLPSPAAAALASLSRSCWECQRRRRRCDMSFPECSKCLADGTVCPGYEEKKPVTWLAPGTVLSRPRRRKSSQQKRDFTNIPEHRDECAKLPRFETDSVELIPRLEWVDESTPILEALDYFNSQIYSTLAPTLELGPSPYAMKIPLEYLPYLSVAYLHSLVSLVISHRIHQLPQGTSSITLNKLRLRIYRHHSIAVSAVRHCIGSEATGISNATTGDILSLMFAELQFSPLGSTWRLHHDGFMKIVELRGGFENVFKSDTTFEYSLISFVIVGIIANTTSPASKQTAAATYVSSMAFISRIYANVIYSTVLCPHALLMHIISINHLRHEVATSNLSSKDSHNRAMALVNGIMNFSPNDWIRPDAVLPNLWLIAGQIYHSAVLLYCISAFQALFLLPETPAIGLMKSSHCAQLYQLLPRALDAPQLRPSMCWPLVVAGQYAEGSNMKYRPFVATALTRMSRDTGVALPLAASDVLESFWASGGNSWEDCFNYPYVFAW